HVDCRDLVKSGRHSRVLCVARPNAPKTAAGISAADKKIAVACHIERSPLRSVRNADRSLPRRAAVGRSAESPKFAREKFGPKLVLKTMAHAGGRPVESKPFLVAAMCISIG